MRYDVCVELYEVSCNKRLTLRPVAMFLLFCLWLHASLTSQSHTLSLSLSHTHTHCEGRFPSCTTPATFGGLRALACES